VTTDRYLSFDTETLCFSAADPTPTVVCVSYAEPSGTSGLVHNTDAHDWLQQVMQWCLATRTTLIGHNVAYDFACISSTWPDLSDLVWQLYDNELVADTIVRQKLSDLARGRYRGFRTETGYFVLLKYDLDSVTHRHLGYRLDKETWRMRYGELLDVPLAQWPADAQDYPVQDAIATLRVYEVQADDAFIYPEGPWFFVDENAQTRAAWWLALTSYHGIMTSPDALELLKDAAAEEIEHLEESLIEAGIVVVTYHKRKATGQTERKATKKKAVVQALVEAACREQGKKPRLTDSGGICADKDACLETGDPLLEAYIDYSSAIKTLNTDCKAYAEGVENPLHTRFESLAATGRTTSSGPNIQNVRWNFPERCTVCRSRKCTDHKCDKCGAPAAYPPGIRECFIPRPGRVFASADYDGLELRTLAQVCLRVVGYSRLAETLNSGADPHMMVAAQLLGKEYLWCKEHEKDDDVQLARQTGKVANFGFPGGLGPDKLVLFARMAYRVRMTRADAVRLKAVWLATFPEFKDYFKHIDTLEDGQGDFTVEHLFSGRLRSKVFYCVACNSYFQGLGADAAKAAGYLIARACYYDRDSPLFGCRIVNYVHDEWILEVPDDAATGWAGATAAANELARLMVEGGAPFLPDVPLTAKPQLMRRWSKKAKRIVDKSTGLLIPWDLAA
jgi:DNA polymerase-1